MGNQCLSKLNLDNNIDASIVTENGMHTWSANNGKRVYCF